MVRVGDAEGDLVRLADFRIFGPVPPGVRGQGNQHQQQSKPRGPSIHGNRLPSLQGAVLAARGVDRPALLFRLEEIWSIGIDRWVPETASRAASPCPLS